jgi:hypothetical protein
MSSNLQTLPVRQSQLRFGTPLRSRRLAWAGKASILICGCLLAACGKEETSKAPDAATKAKSQPASESKLDAAIADAFKPAADQSVESTSAAALKDQAETILSRYPGKNAAELLNVPEVNEKLRNALQKLGQDKALQARIQSSVELAGQIKGLEGATRLDLDVTKYDQPRTSRMLQAVMSEDPKQIVSFLTGEIGEAVPDLSYGGAERAPNGVSIVPDPTKAAAPAKTDLPE